MTDRKTERFSVSCLQITILKTQIFVRSVFFGPPSRLYLKVRAIVC